MMRRKGPVSRRHKVGGRRVTRPHGAGVFEVAQVLRLGPAAGANGREVVEREKAVEEAGEEAGPEELCSEPPISARPAGMAGFRLTYALRRSRLTSAVGVRMSL